MTRARPTAAAVSALVAAALLGGCEPSATAPPATGPAGASATAQPAPSHPKETRVPAPSPAPSVSDQAGLDQALRDAAWANDLRAATRLVARGADVNAKDDTRQSAYLVAASEGRFGLLQLALALRAQVDDKDSWNGTALIRAAERGHASSSDGCCRPASTATT